MAKAASKRRNQASERGWEQAVTIGLGLLLGLALLKFGNPVIFDHLIPQPRTPAEWVYEAWPLIWGYALLAVVLLLSWRLVRLSSEVPLWCRILPLVWLGWQFVAATQTVAPRLTLATLPHFLACAALFYVGLYAFGRVPRPSAFWGILLVAFALVLWVGFTQHYGGLEAMRRYVYEQTDWQSLPPELLYKIQSDRIFGTLLYPNALAGLILLLGPVMVVAAWSLSERFPHLARLTVVGVILYAAGACLYWSGSKAGWLIALAMGGFLFLHLPLKRQWKAALLGIGLLAGLAGFFWKYSDYFEEGAASAVARLQYWEVGTEIFLESPLLGTGPGTFAVPYRAKKPPEAEMAKLAHNDYLEQASDSGLIGFLSYGLWVFGSLGSLYQRGFRMDCPWFVAVWAGLAAWAVQSLVEFGLYIPALAWPAFLLLGWLWSQSDPNPSRTPGGGTTNPSRQPFKRGLTLAA